MILKNQSTNLSNSNKMISEGESNNRKYINPLNKALRIFFKEAVKISLKNPAQSFYFIELVRDQQRAAHRRTFWRGKGVHVPPIMIFSITNHCNLHCQGCYHQALREVSKPELSDQELNNIVGEARDLGISFIVLAGGEPLVRKNIVKITQDYPDVLFLMFTNGLLITDEMAVQFKKQRNLVPLISLEGYDQDTDNRRGEGVFQLLQRTIQRLRQQEVFFGVSLTVTRSNFNTLTESGFIDKITGWGGKLILFVEYTPIEENTDDWLITQQQRLELAKLMEVFRKKYSALFVNVPGDEKDFGGCLSAGRGFVHVSAEGDLEPCPFAPYSDVNLRDKPLKEALQSPFLKAIVENDDHLQESHGSCALWTRREWVRSLLSNSEK
jgi:MoaA/NifB/PqqE/SkfB family radical SAM enzyme